MKNRIIVYLAIGIIALLPQFSCTDYLDKEPDDQLNLENVFSNKTNLERWLSYLYTALPKYYTYDGPDAISDELAPSIGWESQGFAAIFYQNGNWTPINEKVITFWANYPKAIRQAYTLIKYAHPLSDVSEKEINYMKAECRFFIAYFHGVMAMTYGAVPIISEAATELSGSSLHLKQEPFHQVVEWAASEMLEASKALPAQYSESDKYGRITSLICLAMRARLLTFAASDLVNGNQDPAMVGMKNCDGIAIFNSTHNPERWKQAADANKLLIDEAEKAGHKLYKEYLTDGVTIDPFLSYQNAIMLRYNQGNLEIIMPRTYDDAGYFDSTVAPRSMSGLGALGVTQLLVDAFFMKDGKIPIMGYNDDGTYIPNPDSDYSETGYSTSDEKYATNWHYATANGSTTNNENVVVPSDTYKMYCSREPRFYISVLFNEQYHWAGKKKVDFFNEGADGNPHHDIPPAGYLIRKRVDPTFTNTSGTGVYKSRHGVLYRLAEAYLSYAESLNEYDIAKGSNTNRAEVLKYINLIRERAGIPLYSESNQSGKILAPSEALELRDLIRRERRVELNCENGQRWYDLRRWKEAESVLNGKYYGMDMLKKRADRGDYYKRVVYQTRKFISYWWPIPQSEIDKNPNLRQLPGWMN